MYRKAKIVKLLEAKKGQFSRLWIWQWFLIHDTKSTGKKIKDKLNITKITNFCASKDIVTKVKGHRMRENTLATQQ